MTMNRLSNIRHTLNSRTDSEHEQSLIRVVFVAIISVWLFSFGITEAYLWCAAYLFVALLLLFWIIVSPGINPIRRFTGLIGDMLAISSALYLGHEFAAILLAVYLWVITGNGFRYGIRYMLIATLLACGGFIAVVWLSPFWQKHIWFSSAMLLTIMIVPLYMVSLIKKLRHAIALAEEANHAKSQFIANMSHELRTPLNGIIGMNDLSLTTRQSADQKHFSLVIKESAYHLLGLIERILDMAKIEEGKTELVEEAFDLHQLMHGIIAMFEGQANEKGIRIDLYIDPAAPFALIGSPRHLKQILINIIGNAVKFTEHGSVSIFVEPAEHCEQRLVFTVTDTGIGIAESAQEKIFELFTQADSSITRRFGGTGLGTAIAKELTGMMGGSISLQSVEGQGSTFTIEIPFMRQDKTSHESDLSQTTILLLREQGQHEQFNSSLDCWGVQYAEIEDASMLFSKLVDAQSMGQAYDTVILDRNALSCKPELISHAIRDNHELSGLNVILIEPNQSPASDPLMISAGYSSVLHQPVQASLLFNALHVASVAHHCADVISMADIMEKKRAIKPLNILLAEDNIVNQQVMQEILTRAGHKLEIAHDGEEALDALSGEHSFDLVLLDLNMPKVGGLDVLKQFRFMDTSASMPVLMLSADALPDTIRKCMEAGANDYLTKPIHAPALLEKISFYSEQKKSPPEIQSTEQASGDADNDNDVLDEEIIGELFGFIQSTEKCKHLIQSFESSGTNHVDQLEIAAKQKNARDYLLTIHTLKGSAGTLGLKGISSLCNEIELIGSAIQPVEMSRYCSQLRQAIKQGCQSLYDYL